MMRKDRFRFDSFDWISFLLMLLLMGIGLLLVMSATHTETVKYSFFFKKQLLGSLLGLLVYFFCVFVRFDRLCRWGYFAYFFSIGLLIFTYCKGLVALGARRWISLYFFRMQPSELVKFLFPFFVGYFLYEAHKTESGTIRAMKTKDFYIPLAMLTFTTLLVKKQPDLGTAILLFFQGLGIFFIAGLSRKFFLYTFLIFCCAGPIVWKTLKPYQKQRVYVFLGYGEKNKERYQIEQSLIAIGSGGLWGKGLLKGTQNRFSFLPEDHSDFIFAVLCEEFGLVGAFLLLLLFFLLGFRIFFQLLQTESFLARIVGVGQLLHIMLAVFINIGMVIGILPIVGIPLPLISYGLSSLLVTCASLGTLNNLFLE
jgi:rod shape determining protein RodA